MPIEFKADNGSIDLYVKGLSDSVKTTEGDLLFALNNQKTRILERTSRGVDVNEDPFVPYSDSGPYYWTPGKESKSRKSAVNRYARKLGVKDQKTKSGLSIKFKSYGDFKRALGRSVVDLLGPSAPHMLQAFVIKVSGIDYSNLPPKPGVVGKEAFNASLGIYGEEAERATGHNTGNGNSPMREFFGISSSDAKKISDDVEKSILQRLKRFLN